MNTPPRMNDPDRRIEATFYNSSKSLNRRPRGIHRATLVHHEALQRHVRELLRVSEEAGEFLNSAAKFSDRGRTRTAYCKPGNRRPDRYTHTKLGPNGRDYSWLRIGSRVPIGHSCVYVV